MLPSSVKFLLVQWRQRSLFLSDYSFAADIRDVKTSDEDMMETMMIAFYLND